MSVWDKQWLRRQGLIMLALALMVVLSAAMLYVYHGSLMESRQTMVRIAMLSATSLSNPR